jgi:hypothetical protein
MERVRQIVFPMHAIFAISTGFVFIAVLAALGAGAGYGVVAGSTAPGRERSR